MGPIESLKVAIDSAKPGLVGISSDKNLLWSIAWMVSFMLIGWVASMLFPGEFVTIGIFILLIIFVGCGVIGLGPKCSTVSSGKKEPTPNVIHMKKARRKERLRRVAILGAIGGLLGIAFWLLTLSF